MSKILYPIFNLPNEHDEENECVPTWIKWWLLNNYNKKHSWVISEIITGNPLTLNGSVQAKFPMPPLPRGNSEQVQYSGKNKFNNANVQAENSATLEITSLGFNITRTHGSGYGDEFIASNTIEGLKPNTTYTFSLDVESENSFTNSGIYAYSDNLFGTTLTKSNYEQSGNNRKWNITTSSNGKIVIGFYGTTVTQNKIFKFTNIQLEEGSTATSYEPYVGGTASPNPSYPQAITNVTGNVEVLVRDTKIFDKSTIQAGDIINNNATIRLCSRQEMWIKAGTYTFTTNITSPFRYLVGIENVGVPPISNYPNYIYNSEWQTSSSLTFTINEPGYFTLQLSKTANAQLTVDEVMNFDYELSAHQEQTFTFPLGTQRMFLGDYLADDGIHHVRGRIILDGSETWTGAGNVFQSVADTTPNKGDVSSNAYSNYFIHHYYPNAITSNIQNGEFGWNSSKLLTIRNDNVTGSANFKTWLSTHNVIVEYELATEEITPYTSEQQQAYDEIKQALSYEEQTNISGTSDEANPIFKVQYYMKEGE